MASCSLHPENLSPDELSECRREKKMGLQLHAHYLSGELPLFAACVRMQVEAS